MMSPMAEAVTGVDPSQRSENRLIETKAARNCPANSTRYVANDYSKELTTLATGERTERVKSGGNISIKVGTFKILAYE